MKIDEAKQLLKSYSGMTHKLTDNQGRPKLDQAIEIILDELDKKDSTIKTLQEIKKEALLDDLGKQYNIYKHIDSTKCLHCGENIPHYCEKCYQQLISDISKYQGG